MGQSPWTAADALVGQSPLPGQPDRGQIRAVSEAGPLQFIRVVSPEGAYSDTLEIVLKDR